MFLLNFFILLLVIHGADAQSLTLNDTCTAEGKKYKLDKTFIPDSCIGRCQCISEDTYSCIALCPRPKIECSIYEREVIVMKPMQLNRKCYCEERRCKPVQCKVSGKLYKPGERFVLPDCSARCRCMGISGLHCVRLCPFQRCLPGRTAREKNVLVSRKPRCFCKRITRCVNTVAVVQN